MRSTLGLVIAGKNMLPLFPTSFHLSSLVFKEIYNIELSSIEIVRVACLLEKYTIDPK